MDQLPNKTSKANGAQNGVPEDNGLGKMIWVVAGGLVAAFVLAQVLNKDPDSGTNTGVENNPALVFEADSPYVEPESDGTTHHNMKPGFQHPKANIRNAEGEVVPANPAIAEQMRQEREYAEKRRAALRASRDQFRAPPPPGLIDKVTPPPGGWPKQSFGHVDGSQPLDEMGQPDYVVAAFEEMKARGELDKILEAQNRSLQEDLAENPEEVGTGLTQEELDEIRENRYIVFR